MLPTIRLGFGSFEFRGEKKLAKFIYSNSHLWGIFGLYTLNFRQKYKKSTSYKCSWFWTLFEVNKRKNGLVYGYSMLKTCIRMTNRRTKKNRHVITTERLKKMKQTFLRYKLFSFHKPISFVHTVVELITAKHIYLGFNRLF